MASFNRVILVGNLTRDPELHYIPSGTAVTEIGLAVNDRRKNAQGEWVEETTFVDVTLWGRTAEVASEYLNKGSPVLIEGRLKLDTWEKDGKKQFEAARRRRADANARRPKAKAAVAGGGPAAARSRPSSIGAATGNGIQRRRSRSFDDGGGEPPAARFAVLNQFRSNSINASRHRNSIMPKTKSRHQLPSRDKRLPRGKHGGIELLLIQSVDHLGKQGDVVEVKRGYAMNYLLPQGLATIATDHHKRMVEKHKAKLLQIQHARLAGLRQLAERIAAQSVTIEANANDEGHLYGSVGAPEIVTALKQHEITITRRSGPPERPAQGIGPVHGRHSLGPGDRSGAEGLGRADRRRSRKPAEARPKPKTPRQSPAAKPAKRNRAKADAKDGQRNRPSNDQLAIASISKRHPD